MHLNYDKFCSLSGYVVSVKQIPESAERFAHTKKQLKSIGIKTVQKAKAVFVQDTTTVQKLVKRYKLHNFKGRDTHLAGVLSFIRLFERLLKTQEEFFLICEDDMMCAANGKRLFKYYLDQLPSNWDILHLGSALPKQTTKINRTKKFISSTDWCLVNNRPKDTSQIWDASFNAPFTNVPWGGVMGGWCNVYSRKALETLVTNAQHIYTAAGDVANNFAYRDFGLNFLCINRPAEHIDNVNIKFRKTGRSRCLVGLIYQATFRSINDKYSKKHI